MTRSDTGVFRMLKHPCLLILSASGLVDRILLSLIPEQCRNP